MCTNLAVGIVSYLAVFMQFAFCWLWLYLVRKVPRQSKKWIWIHFFMHFQYCGRQESQTDKAKLPWYRHIVPTQPKHQMGWRPTLIRYFIPWTINYFVVQWWCRRQNSGSIIGKGLPHHIQTGWGWESCHKQCPWAVNSLVRLIKVLLQTCPPSPISTWAHRTNLDSNSMSSLQLQQISKQQKVWYDEVALYS